MIKKILLKVRTMLELYPYHIKESGTLLCHRKRHLILSTILNLQDNDTIKDMKESSCWF